MSFNAQFTTFNKKLNSTQRPTTYAHTFTVDLKDNCSIVSPVLRIYNTANFNPAQLNYCYIFEFNRYYFVRDWEYSLGEWICHLNTDVLATYKTYIGTLVKYVLRSSHSYNKDALDTLYPPLVTRPNIYTDDVDFLFQQDFDSSMYVLGVAAGDSDGAGAVSYYSMTNTQMRSLIEEMLKPTSALWSNGFSGMTDTLYRAFYDPFSYIKSCKWFPISYFPLHSEYVKFGNYTCEQTQGQPLSADADDWPHDVKTLNLPSNWLTLDAKYRMAPFANMFIHFNPFGIIPLNPNDLSDSDTIKLYLYPDYISGDAILKIFKVVNNTDILLTQVVTKIGIDVNLTASSIDANGLISGVLNVFGGISRLGNGINPQMASSGAAGAVISGGQEVARAISDFGQSALMIGSSLIPSMVYSSGSTDGSIVSMDGIATLYYTCCDFVDEDNSEYGKPLYEVKVLSTIPGFIKCGDGECSAVGDFMFEGEREAVGEFLVNGFFYE